MDFSNRRAQAAQRTAPQAEPASVTTPLEPKQIDKPRRHHDHGILSRIANYSMLILAALVFCGAVVILALDNDDSDLQDLVDSNAYQLVTLSNDTEYYGDLVITDDVYALQNVFYLQLQTEDDGTNTQNLTPLGCETPGTQTTLHFNPEHVVSWANLRTDGTVSTGIDQWKQSNPNGLECPEPRVTNTDQADTAVEESADATEQTSDTTAQ